MVVSTLTKDGAQQTVEALAAGAADTLEKPAPGGFHEEYKAQLVEKIRQLGKRPLLRSAKDAAPRAAPVMRTLPAGFSPDVVAIGASTGGIQATAQLLAQLPHPLDVPIFITQHLPNEFTQPYARQIEAITGGKVMIAADGQCPGPGDVVLAPGDAHMLIEGNSARLRVRLAQGITDTGCMPSVDLMFASLAAINGLRTLGVVLTGMGRDGTEGARKLVDAGSCVMAQNEGSSVVWGMPGQVVKAGLACAQLHPADLAARIATLCVGKAA
jgi:two-component system chemotaxis response regulator CheB